MSDVYMDDLLTGADDSESGRKLQEQLVSLLKGAGMELHKWSASNPLLLPDSMCQDKTFLILLLPRARPLDSCGSHIQTHLLSRFLP
ncbi:hypothetical protein TNCT_237521 [Trichonephila clavata]|uniref:Uncharacterized protein n=1 Tax=Trichonephila clavata TaxID=2740835 RepID=A0A8X6KU65_TRICU|nr:hypothetical protein TNCT_237521 [Trichonephila clavata]